MADVTAGRVFLAGRSVRIRAGPASGLQLRCARLPTAEQHAAPGPEPAAAPAGGAVIAARLAWTVLVAVLLGFATEGVNAALAMRYGARPEVLAITAIVLITALQLYHSRAVRAGSRPRAWPVTLGLQAVLVYASFLPFVDAIIGGMAPFLAGSVLLLVPGRWRWAGYAAVVASIAVLPATVPVHGVIVLGGHQVGSALFYAAATANFGLVVYGLARLAALARQLEAMHGELARMAVVRAAADRP
jgi:two-component system, NarL family, sensor histidine kinase DesK